MNLDIKEKEQVLDLLNLSLSKREFKKVMDFMHKLSHGQEVFKTLNFYNQMLEAYYSEPVSKKTRNNVTKLKVIKQHGVFDFNSDSHLSAFPTISTSSSGGPRVLDFFSV